MNNTLNTMNKFIIALATMVVMFSACTREQVEHGHGHEHGPEPLAYTLYSDKSEIFVEFKPLVVGNTSKFAAHFTLLGETFLPLTEGSVTVSLIVGDNGIRQTADTPIVPGIYRLSLTPKVAGKGKLVFDINTKSFTDQIVIDGIEVYPDEKTAEENQTEDGGGGDITYLKEQAWKVEFANQEVQPQPFSDVIKTSGQILPAPGDETVISANASGVVLFSGSKTIIGSEVSAGTQLFTITGGNLAEGNIEAKYKEAKANYDKAKVDFERAKELVKDKIIPEKEYQEAKLKFESAEIAFNAIAKNYSEGGQIITSPSNGYLKNILVNAGEYVEAGAPLAVISKNKKLILQANVSQKYFSQLPSIASANFKAANSEEVFSTKDLNGKVISYGKSANATSPFIPVTFEIDNAGSIIPGSIVEVYLETKSIPDALVVPITALIEEQGKFFVYVQAGGESFEKREVELGASNGKNVRILSGLNTGERVVSKGAYQIKLSTASGTLPAHGHEH